MQARTPPPPPPRAVARSGRTRALLGLSLLASALLGCAEQDLSDPEPTSGSALALEPRGRSAPRQSLKDELAALRAQSDLVGVAAQVQTEQRAEFARVGSNDPREHSPLPRDAQFRIASVTKSFTAVVVLQLVAESKLALSDSVERWLPGVVAGHGNDGTKITVKQLLQHTSGLVSYVEDPALGALVGSAASFAAHRFDAISQAELVAIAMQHPPLFAAGERFSYSDTNYVLLGMLIEAVTGQAWRAQIEHRIIASLALTRTYVPGYSPFLVGVHARGYMSFPDADELVDVTDTSLVSAADGGVVSTLSDLNRFFRALVRGELLPQTLLAQMLETIAVDEEAFPQGRYGLGIQWTPLSCGGGYFHHAGDTLGFSTRTGVTSDGRRSVVLYMNSPINEATQRAAAELVDRALCSAD